ncbi:MAG: ABC transporter ATP-binding protein [Pseudomonadota bacterium]
MDALTNASINDGTVGTAGTDFAGSLRFKDVSRRFGDHWALQGLSLDVKPGETMCLLGESGCGKTTALRIAAGIERQTSGTIELNGVEIAGPKSFMPPEKRNMSLVFQDYALFPHMTILQNVMFGLSTLRKPEAENIARETLARVRIEEYAASYPHMLSGGQQQRVALARAIAPRPQVMFLDEPFSGLDSVLRDTVREETMAVLRETQATSIIVTHDPEEALYMADRIALMRNGRIEQIGTPQELYLKPVNGFAAGFFGGMNVFPGTVVKGNVATPLGTFAAIDFENGAKVDVMVRIEGVEVFDTSNGSEQPTGRVLSQRFAGETAWMSVLVDGGTDPITLKRTARKQLKSDLVSFVVDPAAVLIFTTSAN